VRKILLFVPVAALILAVIWSHMTALHLGYEIEQLHTQRLTLQRRLRQLETRAASLRSPAHLERVAREEFGLGLPQAGQVIIVRRQPPGAGLSAGRPPVP